MDNPQIDDNGDQFWYNKDGKFHRTDGPAVIWADGDQEWWLNGERHRTDAPAVIHANGARRWFLNGKFHRTNGPAYITVDGDQYWFLNGNQHDFDEWLDVVDISDEGKVMLKLQYG